MIVTKPNMPDINLLFNILEEVFHYDIQLKNNISHIGFCHNHVVSNNDILFNNIIVPELPLSHLISSKKTI